VSEHRRTGLASYRCIDIIGTLFWKGSPHVLGA
jgi:hypothetical protein